MNPSPDPRSPAAEVRDLCDVLLDGQLTLEQHARLETLVRTEPDARRTYVEYLHLHAALRDHARAGQPKPLAEILAMSASESAGDRTSRNSTQTLIAFPWRGRQGALALAASLALLIGGIAFGWLGGKSFSAKSPQRPFATLVSAKGCRWQSSGLPTEVGAPLGAGRLHLAEGIAKVEFPSGVGLTLEGPADLELRDATHCFLHSGAIVAHVPETVSAFTVETAAARVNDRGVDYAVSANADGRALVQVFNGQLHVRHQHSGEQLALANRRTAEITTTNLLVRTGDSTEGERWPWLRRTDPLRTQQMTLTSAGGRGRAAYVASTGTLNHFSDTLLLLKNTHTGGYRRKAVIGFDLGPVPARRVEDASLTLNFEPTGFGFASFVADSEFTVYALTDDAQDDWNPDTMTWENSPAADPSAAAVDPTKAVRVGSFALPQGVLGGAFSISGRALAERINLDANRYLTLIVVRETPESIAGGVVHGFAGNQHPQLAPPTLRLQFEPPKVAAR
jgi:hypothetical protein